MQTILRDALISFPMFGDFTINPPSTFVLFGRTFYLYGAVIALGFLLGILYCAHRSEKFVGIPSDDLYDFVLWLIPTVLVGARLYYVIFRWNEYSHNLLDIFKVWEGGLAIYGGILAGLVLVILWCRKRSIPFGALGDLSVFGLLIGQSIGRWGNFLNREAFGRETDVFCRMGLTMPGKNPIYVHPTFLYESLWNLVGFLALHFWFKYRKRRFDGEVMLLYVAWYGLGRFMIEGLRKRLADQSLKLELTDAAKALIIERGYDPLYGARPLRRMLQSSVETLIARTILRGDLSAGATITVDVQDGELVCR